MVLLMLPSMRLMQDRAPSIVHLGITIFRSWAIYDCMWISIPNDGGRGWQAH